ncbi:MAG: undecaprenyl-diphosphate phosphatase [Lentisphaeria bacterium]|nr:undecaprenyl-diphosphate phosphatase [Lentisphaeria bacterium]
MLFEIILLAVIQGVSEFLPISSSGHLTLFQHVLEIQTDASLVTILLHAGTLVSILIYYYKDIWRMISFQDPNTLRAVVIGTIPLVIGGVFLKKLLDFAGENLWVVGIGFLTSFAFLVFVFRRDTGSVEERNISAKTAFWVGLTQCLAVIPGISRSGSTISSATRGGISRAQAAKFSFFLGIPAIMGAIVLEAGSIVKDYVREQDKGPQVIEVQTSSLESSLETPKIEVVTERSFTFFELFIGFVCSALVGYVSIVILIKVLSKNGFQYFGYYCLLMFFVTLWQIFKG